MIYICRKIIKLSIQSRVCITFSMHDSKYTCFSPNEFYIYLMIDHFPTFIAISHAYISRFAFPIYTTIHRLDNDRDKSSFNKQILIVHERLEILLMSRNFTRIDVNNIFVVTIDIDTICFWSYNVLYSEFLKCYIIISAERPSAYLFICRYVDASDWLAINRLLQHVKARIECGTCPSVNGADKSVKFVRYNFTQFGRFCWSD